MTTGQRIHFARKQAGLTQAQLAEMIGVGTRPATISDLENDRLPVGRYLAAIAEATGYSADFLLGLDASPVGILAAKIANLPDDRRALVEQLVTWLAED